MSAVLPLQRFTIGAGGPVRRYRLARPTRPCAWPPREDVARRRCGPLAWPRPAATRWSRAGRRGLPPPTRLLSLWASVSAAASVRGCRCASASGPRPPFRGTAGLPHTVGPADRTRVLTRRRSRRSRARQPARAGHDGRDVWRAADRSGRAPLLRFRSPSAYSGHAALSGAASPWTFPLRRYDPLAASEPSPARPASGSPSLRSFARRRDARDRRYTRPAHRHGAPAARVMHRRRLPVGVPLPVADRGLVGFPSTAELLVCLLCHRARSDAFAGDDGCGVRRRRASLPWCRPRPCPT
jgi:hypothetical protein